MAADGGIVSWRDFKWIFAERRSVREDWIAWLPAEKSRVFEEVVRQWEGAYGMLSVALDEALSLRLRGELVRARQEIAVAAELLDRLASTIVCVLEALVDLGRHLPRLPTVAPLNPDFFRGEIAKTAASWNTMLHRVLLGDRSRFFHKLHALSDTLEDVAGEFCEAAEEIAEGACARPGPAWAALDFLHYDVNTCMREAVVVLKSFLRTFPDQQLPLFRQRIEASPRPLRQRRPAPGLSRAPT